MARKKLPQGWIAPTSLDLYHGINIDYDRRYAEDHDERCRNDYCRCQTIEDAEVTSVDILRVVEQILDQYKHFAFRYAVDRLVRIHKMYDKSKYTIRVVKGYYGEEVDGVVFEGWSELMRDVHAAYQLRDNLDALVQFLLTAEYGYVLDRLEGLTWRIIEVPVKDLRVANDHYLGKVSNEVVEIDDTLPIGIYTMKNGKYTLVDGYHRYTVVRQVEAKQRKEMMVQIIAGTEKHAAD